jgi:hypothetical protein
MEGKEKSPAREMVGTSVKGRREFKHTVLLENLLRWSRNSPVLQNPNVRHRVHKIQPTLSPLYLQDIKCRSLLNPQLSFQIYLGMVYI